MKKMLHHGTVILLSLLGIVFLNVGFMFVLLGLLPTVVAYFVDETPDMDLYKTVRAANLAGMLPTLVVMSGNSYPGAVLQIAMNDSKTWMMVYGSAGLGWILVWLSQWIAYLYILALGEVRIAQLEEVQKALVKEWGEDLTQYVISTQ